MGLTNRITGLGPPEIDIDKTTEILSNKRRREVIELLNDADVLTLGEAAEEIGEAEGDFGDVNPRRRVYISLHQTHLPRMDEYGAVDYNDDRKTIARGKEYDDYLWALQMLKGD